MGKSNNAQLETSALEFLNSLFQKEFADQIKYDPEVVQLVEKHLGQKVLYPRAGFRLADDLIQLAKARAMESDQ
ncbi:MAG TPA: hypothetical protein EYP49_15300 [Anaerolineae bacterium]|nr:hypothetical protein [Anaerolineae bacterium]